MSGTPSSGSRTTRQTTGRLTPFHLEIPPSSTVRTPSSGPMPRAARRASKIAKRKIAQAQESRWTSSDIEIERQLKQRKKHAEKGPRSSPSDPLDTPSKSKSASSKDLQQTIPAPSQYEEKFADEEYSEDELQIIELPKAGPSTHSSLPSRTNATAIAPSSRNRHSQSPHVHLSQPKPSDFASYRLAQRSRAAKRSIRSTSPSAPQYEPARKRDVGQIEHFKEHDEEQRTSAALCSTPIRMKALETELEKTKQELELSRTDLNNSRAFVEMDDAGDVESVIMGLKDLGDTIDLLAYQMVRKHGRLSFSCIMLRTEISARIRTKFPAHASLAVVCYQYGLNWEDFLLYAAPSVMISIIQDSIFTAFKIGLDESVSNMLYELHEGISRTEPQHRAARWRSITYERCLPSSEVQDEQYCTALVHDILATLVALFSLPLPDSNGRSSAPEKVDLSEWFNPLLDITRKALRWRHKTRKGHLSYDYEPFIDRSEDCIAIQGFGLWSRTSESSDGNGKGKAREGSSDQLRIVTELLMPAKKVTKMSLGEGISKART